MLERSDVDWAVLKRQSKRILEEGRSTSDRYEPRDTKDALWKKIRKLENHYNKSSRGCWEWANTKAQWKEIKASLKPHVNLQGLWDICAIKRCSGNSSALKNIVVCKECWIHVLDVAQSEDEKPIVWSPEEVVSEWKKMKNERDEEEDAVMRLIFHIAKSWASQSACIDLLWEARLLMLWQEKLNGGLFLYAIIAAGHPASLPNLFQRWLGDLHKSNQSYFPWSKTYDHPKPCWLLTTGLAHLWPCSKINCHE